MEMGSCVSMLLCLFSFFFILVKSKTHTGLANLGPPLGIIGQGTLARRLAAGSLTTHVS